ncbi:MAG: LytTR family DNA-binding domain-containing protein [Kangiellaceae bacterium]|nr:LytTR family DNA-binding domain-containing protein [Kangiellaceae bacterium]MCW8998597.1 LytTR family DNA-binding domain-containing protein [Kangiellaceae bacterium]MCW9015675.1 LytTR family DNA-binding domain-containing protein [Kangiellaceae bacterium]
MQIKTLIVDDEKLARRTIAASLEEFPKWQAVGECDRGDQVLSDVQSLNPDVVFLDIKMPGMDGLEVCRQLQDTAKPPVIIFVTAFDAHAVEAFELCALDYLLKPYDDKRFSQCLERAEDLLTTQQTQSLQIDQLNKVSDPKNQNTALETLIVRSVGRIQLISVADVKWLSTAGNYVELHMHEQAILHRVSMSFLEKHLNDADFIRVHRKSMIRLSQVSEFLTLADGQYAVILKNGDKVNVSQSYKENLLNRLGIE